MGARVKTEYFDRIISYVEDCVNRKGRCPSIQEMEADLKIPHTTISRYLKRMQDAGLIEWNGTRNIKTLDMINDRHTMHKAPKYDLVACGEMDNPDNTPEEYVKLPCSVFGDSELFLVGTIGTSMTNAGIDKNDLLVCEPGRTPKRGDIVVVLFPEDNVTSCKYYDPEQNSNKVYFRAASPYSYDRDIESEKGRFVIQGVVVKSIKNSFPDMKYTADHYIDE